MYVLLLVFRLSLRSERGIAKYFRNTFHSMFWIPKHTHTSFLLHDFTSHFLQSDTLHVGNLLSSPLRQKKLWMPLSLSPLSTSSPNNRLIRSMYLTLPGAR